MVEPTRDLLLGIDIGTTNAKAALVGLDGKLVATAQRGYELHHVRPNWVEQNPDDWWQAACISIREVLAAARASAARIAGVAVSSEAPCLVLMDARGAAVRPAMLWMDRRAESEASAMSDTFGFSEIVSRTGNRPDAFFTAAKFRWLRSHEPESLAACRNTLLANGYVVFKLTGELTLDRSHASLLQLRDLASDAWLTDICVWCGAEAHWFAHPADAHAVGRDGDTPRSRGIRVARRHTGHGRYGGQIRAAALEVGA